MDEKSRSAVSHKYAELTAVLEDAAELAANGQSPTRGLSDLKRDIDQLWELLSKGIGLVSSIENLVRAERYPLQNPRHGPEIRACLTARPSIREPVGVTSSE